MILITGRSIKGKKGFTLLELLFVMLIAAVLVARAAPYLGSFTGARKTLNFAYRIAALTDYARSMAVSEGRVYVLNADYERGILWLTAQKGGSFERLSTEHGRDFLLPEGINIEIDQEYGFFEKTNVPGLAAAGYSDLAVVPPVHGVFHVTFYPGAIVQPAVFRISDSRGNVFKVISRSPSEGFMVKEQTGI